MAYSRRRRGRAGKKRRPSNRKGKKGNKRTYRLMRGGVRL